MQAIFPSTYRSAQTDESELFVTRTEYGVAGQDCLYFSPKGSCSSYSIILVDNALKLDPTHFFPSGPACTSRGCALEEAHVVCEDLDSRSSLGARG